MISGIWIIFYKSVLWESENFGVGGNFGIN
jgi:hypothetical protein